MAANFVLKIGRKKPIELATMGYTKFNLSRGYWMACYDIGFARLWLNFLSKEGDRISAPKEVLPLFSRCDCDGYWTNKELHDIVKSIKSLQAYTDEAWLKEAYRRYAETVSPNKILKNVVYKWRENALALLEMIEKAAQSGGKVVWW